MTDMMITAGTLHGPNGDVLEVKFGDVVALVDGKLKIMDQKKCNVLGSMLFEARKERGGRYPLSIKKAADQAGIKMTTFARTERGETVPDLLTFYRLCKWIYISSFSAGVLLYKMFEEEL